MNIVTKRFALIALALALNACGANGNSPTPPTGVVQLSQNVLQMAVGTANLFGTSKGLNVVITYRQPSNGFAPGDSGALVSSPSLHFPMRLPSSAGSTVGYDGTSTAWTGPSRSERGSHTAGSTSQAPNSAQVTTFGQSGGAFGIGIEPFNLYGPADAPNPGVINSPFQVAPYPVPLYNASGNVNVFEPWGGPPAFDLLGNGQSPVGNSQVPTGQAGLSMGLDVFAIAPATGSYGVTVFIATSSGNTTQSASAHLNAGIELPAAKTPDFVYDGNGGGALAFTMPAGASEAYVQVTDYGPAKGIGCNNATTSSSSYGKPIDIYYTMRMKSSGTARLPDKAGPTGLASVCVGDQITVQSIAFDYPMYEASYPASLHDPKPTILGHRGQDDVTISPANCWIVPKGSGKPASTCTLPLTGQPQ